MSSPPLDLEQAYVKYGHGVLRRARVLLGNEEDAREMVHEIFVGLLEAPEQHRGRSSLATWLYSATTHRCLNRIRDRKNQLELLRERVAPAQTEATSGGADGAALRQLLLALPEELAAVAVYHYLDEMTQQEIADTMGRSRRHVVNSLERLAEPCQGAFIAYSVAGPVLTLSPRLSVCFSGFENEYLRADANEYALELKAARTWDWPLVSLEAGLAAGASLLEQTFDTEGNAHARRNLAASIAASAGATAELSAALYLLLEAGLQSYALRLTRGNPASTAWEVALALRSYAGLGWYW